LRICSGFHVAILRRGGHYVHFRGMFWGFVELTAASKAYLLLAAQLK
jgi:thiamine transporter ThiT